MNVIAVLKVKPLNSAETGGLLLYVDGPTTAKGVASFRIGQFGSDLGPISRPKRSLEFP